MESVDQTASITSGMPAVDGLLGGLIPGDNVVWVGADDSVWRAAVAAFVEASTARRPTLLVACTAEDRDRTHPAAEVIDATPGSQCARPAPLADAIDAFLQANPASAIVIRGLADLAKRWGDADAAAFFARTCPSMLQAGALTYWWLPDSLPAVVIDRVRQVTQVMLELRGTRLHVSKAESRPASVVGSVHDVEVVDGRIELRWNPSAGRLARGLTAVRRDLGLSQAQLARLAGVTPSAISQAESGHRGLSVDTLITLSDRLGVSLDRLVSAQERPGYVLARHDRSRTTRSGTVALADDAALGLRTYLVVLDAQESGEPQAPHPGIELVAVVRGLVQIEIGDDAPVLRAGDSLVASTASIRRWSNLRPDPAAFYWVLRD